MGRVTHGHARHGATTRRSPTWLSWRSMLQRCNTPTNASYQNYGGRGITVCDRWLEFSNFLADMGERPEGKTLDRIDPNGHYEPGNCRWATWCEQNRNKRQRTHCTKGHELTPENTRVDRNGYRQCRICERARNRATRELRKQRLAADNRPIDIGSLWQDRQTQRQVRVIEHYEVGDRFRVQNIKTGFRTTITRAILLEIWRPVKGQS